MSELLDYHSKGLLSEQDYKVVFLLAATERSFKDSRYFYNIGNNRIGLSRRKESENTLNKALELGDFSTLAEPVKDIWMRWKMEFGIKLTDEEMEFVKNRLGIDITNISNL